MLPNVLDVSALRRALDRLEQQTIDQAMTRAGDRPVLAAHFLGVAPAPARPMARP